MHAMFLLHTQLRGREAEVEKIVLSHINCQLILYFMSKVEKGRHNNVLVRLVSLHVPTVLDYSG